MEYCCHSMKRCIDHKEMVYDSITRSFMFYINDEEWGGPGTYNKKICKCCPFCGSKLPKDLYGDEYDDALEEAVGKDLCDLKEEEIPEEFKSDEWWRKRGL